MTTPAIRKAIGATHGSSFANANNPKPAVDAAELRAPLASELTVPATSVAVPAATVTAAAASKLAPMPSASSSLDGFFLGASVSAPECVVVCPLGAMLLPESEAFLPPRGGSAGASAVDVALLAPQPMGRCRYPGARGPFYAVIRSNSLTLIRQLAVAYQRQLEATQHTLRSGALKRRTCRR